MIRFTLLLRVAFLFFALSCHGQNQATPGTYTVTQRDVEWTDTKRSRTIPARIYEPTEAGTYPLTLFSHGLGGSREGAAYLGKHWASHGYVCVHIQHPGSDSELLKKPGGVMNNLKQAVKNPSNAYHRPLDVSFAIDQIDKMAASDGFPVAKPDLQTIGMSGHSFGAYTTMAVTGRTFHTKGGTTMEQTDPRISAAIVMSAAVQDGSFEDVKNDYATIRVPTLFMTGTEDTSPITSTTPEQRTYPFRAMSLADAYLLNLLGGDHMIFSGRSRKAGAKASDERFHQIILDSSTTFWNAYLKKQSAARARLSGTEWHQSIQDSALWETKIKTP